MHRGLGGRGPALGGNLPQRRRWIPLSKLGHLTKLIRQPAQPTVRLELADRRDLPVRSPARPDEIRVVGVRHPVRPRARLGDDRVLVEGKRGVAGSGEREGVGNCLGTPRVGGCIAAAVVDAKLDVVLRGDRDEQLGAGTACASDLEMRRSWPAHRPASEERTADVRVPAACATDDTPRRRLEWSVRRGEDPGPLEDAERAIPTGNVDLVPGRTVERVLCVRPDLGFDTERPQKAEGSSSHGRLGNVQVNGELAVGQ